MNQGHSSPSAPPVPQPDKGDSRRDFIWLTLGWLASLFALGASGFATLRSLVPNVLYEPSRRYSDFEGGMKGCFNDVIITIKCL